MKLEVNELLDRVDRKIASNTSPMSLEYNIEVMYAVQVAKSKLNHILHKNTSNNYEKLSDWVDVTVNPPNYGTVLVSPKENAPSWVTEYFI